MGHEHRHAGQKLRRENPRRGADARAQAGESERTKEMQRPRDVLQQKPDRDQVGHDAPRARQAVVRLVLRPGNVRNRHLGNPRAAPSGQRRNEPVQIAIEADSLDDRRAIGLERRAEVVERYARQLRHQPVGQLRRQPARPEVVDALLSPPADDVVPVVQLCEQRRNFLGRVLQVAVHRDDDVAGGRVESSREGGGLAVIPRQVDHPHARIALGHDGERRRRPVGASVVDVDDFGVESQDEQHGGQATVQLVERPGFVEERYDDR